MDVARAHGQKWGTGMSNMVYICLQASNSWRKKSFPKCYFNNILLNIVYKLATAGKKEKKTFPKCYFNNILLNIVLYIS